MIIGDPLTFDLRTHSTGRQEFVVFEIDDERGIVVACKWEMDANPFQVAAALERMAAKLRNPEI